MSDTIQSVLNEDRVFEPDGGFAEQAHTKSLDEYRKMHTRSVEDPEGFWREQGESLIPWMKPFDKVLEWNEPFAKWFVGGQTNASVVCLDRHLDGWRKNKAAIVWEGEPGDQKTLTYGQLHREVCKAANALAEMGVKKGDRVAIYMPMVPEAAIAMLACARLGAPHNVVFGGFSAESLRERINDAGCAFVITADGGWRRGKVVSLKPAVDDAIANGACPTVQKVLVLKRTENEVTMQDGRDVWWHEAVNGASHVHEAEPMDAEHPLFMLYTSGSTGKPKGILHHDRRLHGRARLR